MNLLRTLCISALGNPLALVGSLFAQLFLLAQCFAGPSEITEIAGDFVHEEIAHNADTVPSYQKVEGKAIFYRNGALQRYDYEVMKGTIQYDRSSEPESIDSHFERYVRLPDQVIGRRSNGTPPNSIDNPTNGLESVFLFSSFIRYLSNEAVKSIEAPRPSTIINKVDKNMGFEHEYETNEQGRTKRATTWILPRTGTNRNLLSEYYLEYSTLDGDPFVSRINSQWFTYVREGEPDREIVTEIVFDMNSISKNEVPDSMFTWEGIGANPILEGYINRRPGSPRIYVPEPGTLDTILRDAVDRAELQPELEIEIKSTPQVEIEQSIHTSSEPHVVQKQNRWVWVIPLLAVFFTMVFIISKKTR